MDKVKKKFFAVLEKVALMVVNGTYNKLATHPEQFIERTEKAAAKTATKLTEMGFSVRHKTLNIICFTWALFYFCGHGSGLDNSACLGSVNMVEWCHVVPPGLFLGKMRRAGQKILDCC